MKYKELINRITGEANYFILDSHGTKNVQSENEHGDKEFKRYAYSIKRFGKLKVGDYFIYRRPQKSSKDRKFYFYGYGKISRIDIDADGRAIAYIEEGYRMTKPLSETSEYLKNMEWVFKTKKKDSFEHFFNQYGMTMIDRLDFENILKNSDFIEAESCVEENIDEKLEVVATDDFKKEYIIEAYDEGILKTDIKGGTKKVKKVIPRKIDYKKLNDKKMYLGDLGEFIVLEFERARLKAAKREDLAELVEQVSKSKGAGLGYDIKSFEINGAERLIEVKTTEGKHVDGFYMSANEMTVALESKESLYIYRIYNLNRKEKEGKFSLRVYNGKEIHELFNLKPVSYYVKFK